jgi:hypothetical protein
MIVKIEAPLDEAFQCVQMCTYEGMDWQQVGFLTDAGREEGVYW